MLRDFNFCVIDEVDSILIDEARTPLIISGPSDKSSDRWALLSIATKVSSGVMSASAENALPLLWSNILAPVVCTCSACSLLVTSALVNGSIWRPCAVA